MTEGKQYKALLDANVLYPAPIRDIFLQLAKDRLYQAKWTEWIQQEWIDALIRNEPQRDRTVLERTRYIMNSEIPDALIHNFEYLIKKIKLPDPNDHHVLAAAIHGKCNLIVTQNLRDFPADSLGTDTISVVHPDRFLTMLFTKNTEPFCRSIRRVRSRLTNPPYSVDEYLDNIDRNELETTASHLRQFTHFLD